MGRLQCGVGAFLAGLGVDHLHAKHLFHGEKPFKNLSWSRRAEIADEAKAITMKYATVGLSVILTNDEYQEIFKENVPKNVTFHSKYGICFRHIMSFLPQLVNIVQPDRPHKIFIVLEAGHKNQGAAAAMLAEYKSIADRLLARMVKGVSYAEKRECFGVQAADMLAFTSLRIEREELVKQVTTDITSETVIEGHNRPYVFRIPITREMAYARESGGSKYCGLRGFADQHAVGNWCRAGADAEQGVEGSVTCPAPIEAEHELIEVVLEVDFPQSVVDAQAPALEV